MSPSVSQIEYWKVGDSEDPNNNTNQGGDNAVYLSYDLFLGLSILGGFLGLDHLYLRSPLTFLAKVVINIMFFGVWWLYDASQALFNKNVVQTFGLGIPGLGPKGIAAGVLARDIPDKKHFRFFIYSIALFFGGMFGLDLFLLDDSKWGFFQLIMTLSIVLSPIALIEWGYRIYQFVFNTKEVLNDNHEFFGAIYQPMTDRLRRKYPFLSIFFSPIEWFRSFLESILGPVIKPVTASIDGVVALGNKTLDTGRAALDTGKSIVNSVSKVIDVATQSSAIIPGVSLYSSITPGAISESKAKLSADADAPAPKSEPSFSESTPSPTLTGGALSTLAGMASVSGILGSNLNLVHYTLIGTIVIIIVAGISLTFYRAKSDIQNDSPPEPRVFREFDSKGSGA